MSKDKIAVIGAGIIGLAIAYKLSLQKKKVVVFEKESAQGMHQSGRNSGVLHCGLYYTPGSLKARLSVEGIREMIAFAKTNDIPHDICGKVVVATSEKEEKSLDLLAKRGVENGLKGLKYLSPLELKKRILPLFVSSSIDEPSIIKSAKPSVGVLKFFVCKNPSVNPPHPENKSIMLII